MNELFSAVAESLPRVASFGALASVTTLITASLCSVAWAWKDARERTHDPGVQLALVLPVVVAGVAGLPIYLAARPLQRRSDARAADRYLEVLLERVAVHGLYCACGSTTRPEWVYCPACAMALQSACGTCGVNGPRNWAACAYCGTDHGGVPATPLLLPAPMPAPVEIPAAAATARAAAAAPQHAELTVRQA